jgi:hypothetical protein
LVGVESGDARRGDWTRGDDANGPTTSLGLVKESIGRFSVVPKAEATGGTGLTCGQEGGEGGGVTCQLIGGLAFHKCHGVRTIETDEATVGFPSLGQSEEFGASARNKKDDDAMGTSTDEVADVAVGEADKGEKDSKGEKLGSPPFCSHLPSKAERAGRAILLGCCF